MTDLPDNFWTMALSEKMTPYTSFASSSKGSLLIDPAGAFAAGAAAGGGDDRYADDESPTATTIPDETTSVFLGLVNSGIV
jgi:hypothetical protein